MYASTALRTDHYELTMLAGARGLLQKPLSQGELLGVIHEVFEVEQSRIRRLEDMAKANAVQGRAGDPDGALP